MSEHRIILVTCPDRATAAKIGSVLVEEKIAACANLVDGVTSIFRWKNEIHQDAEVLLMVKTRAARFADVERRVLELHPYEVPEIIACDITAGNLPYLNWIDESTQ
ncbi:MAG TPA: divalent-cation tolerance protein CutA [Gammaproteobacteria bacterium]